MDDWKEVDLEAVAAELTVGHVGPMVLEYRDSGVPFIRSTDIEPFKIKRDQLKFINPEFHARLKKSSLKPGDVLIVRTGKPGTCAMIPDDLLDANCSDVVIVRTGPDLHPRYLTYYINSAARGHIDAYSGGAVQQHFNVGAARSIRMNLPPIVEQERIVGVLGALDDKIDLLHRQNKTLEAMAETLFRQWFVEEAEEGWEEYVLTDVASHCKDSENPGQYPTRIYQHYSLPAYDQGRKPSPELGDTIKSSKYVVPENAVLVSKLNPRFPRVWPVRVKKHEHPISSTEFQVFVPKQAEMFGFLYCFLISKPVQDELASAASGTSGSHQRVSPDDIKGLSFQAKSKQQVIDFSKVVDPLLEKIETNKDQVANLTKLRDTLLPKLMSGEVRVEEFQFT